MNESETRAELIDPGLKACGWGVVEGSKILREYNITAGKIQTSGVRAKKLTADYVLVYKGIKLAVVEAKSDELEVGEGVAQAKQYAEKIEFRNHLFQQRKRDLQHLYENRRGRVGCRLPLPLKSFGTKRLPFKTHGGKDFLPFLLKIKAVLGKYAIIRNSG